MAIIIVSGINLIACTNNGKDKSNSSAFSVTKTKIDDSITYSAINQEYKSSPADNPLKGFMPFKIEDGSKTSYSFPHSMEWWYIPLSSLMDGQDSYTFETGLEPVLNDISSRGHQAVFRVYLDYPNRSDNAVPQFIWDMGVAKHSYDNAAGVGVMPDWKDQKLMDVINKFVVEFGKRYDGDSRIGFITLGMIGHWGECHTWPEDDLMPTDTQMDQFFKTYDDSFNKTKIVARYPNTANVSSFNIGFHDDSFTESTLDLASWYFMTRMRKANATNKWKTEAIGGEFRPENQNPFINGTTTRGMQDYDKCINDTHCSWLIFDKVFMSASSVEQFNRMKTASQKLGYEFTLYSSSMSLSDNAYKVTITIDNNGIAPFYYDWPVQFALIDTSNVIVKTYDTDWALTKLLPSSEKELSTNLNLSDVISGSYILGMTVKNPLSNGKVLKFANKAQDSNLEGYLTLGTITKK